MEATAGGEVTSAVLDWYGRFAQGRPGAIVVEATGIRDIPSGPLLRIGAPRFRDGLSKLVERVKSESDGDTQLFIQLIDFLPIKRRPIREKFLNRFLIVKEEHYRKMEVIGYPCQESTAIFFFEKMATTEKRRNILSEKNWRRCASDIESGLMTFIWVD